MAMQSDREKQSRVVQPQIWPITILVYWHQTLLYSDKLSTSQRLAMQDEAVSCVSLLLHCTLTMKCHSSLEVD